ncbi:hypothetical protein Slin15195_G094620 [Septoria linicola]|uniref:Uncharacterized protein n=1 Tax=Septoria linicola TaxID=215465 RepID=A0A9Q9B221_9PEZI|nr:hypothetical protein Slin15195_G094620 [Septoria linicola]
MVGTLACLRGIALLATAALGREVAMAENSAEISKEMYESGEVHKSLKAAKLAAWSKVEAAGVFNAAQYPELGYTKCVNNFAEAIKGDRNNTFRCQNMGEYMSYKALDPVLTVTLADLYHFLNHADLGDPSGEGSSSWGWTSDTGREFVAIGQFQGTAFVEIGSDGKMKYLGRLPAYSETYKSFVVIGSEARNHVSEGIQIFDTRKLLALHPASPKQFTQEDLTS